MAESLALLVALAIFVAIPVMLVVVIVLWAQKVGREREATWTRVARRLGLEYARGTVFGSLDGQQVSLRTETRGSGKSKRTYTVVTSMLSLPLDLGLRVTQQGYFDDALAAIGLKTDILIGDPAFDAAFLIGADEAHRAQALLTPSLKHALSRITESVMLSDAGFWLEVQGTVDDEKWLTWALRTAANIATRMEESRKRVPVATPLAGHRAEWKRFAASVGLSRISTPLCMWGELEGTHITAHAVRVGPLTYQMDVRVKFDLPLHMGLFVRPASTFDDLATLFGREDHRLGDPAFDPAFVVQTARPDRLPEVLEEGARRLLIELNRRFGSVQVTDEGISIRVGSVPADPRAVPALAGRVREAAKRISENAVGRGAAKAGPYR
jgi:hypothetical protein